ncbi:MAG TPA: hypothetical protein VLZ33_02700, partial [Dysgonamonadaceae bacterium]|nr:hypothetical protein [Dysgonamonadaceae bacterium]
MNTTINKLTLLSIVLFLISFSAFSQTIDITDAKIFISEKKDKLVLKSVSVLQEEVEKRSAIKIPVSKKWSKSDQTIIVVGIEGELTKLPDEIQINISGMSAIKSEGYKILVNDENKMVAVIGADARGVLYGIGKLLRTMEMRQGQILVPADFKISSSPAFPIRGHQMGYRPKTNAYDAWSPAQFDSYIRDLAIFGANSIEIMPPRTDDDFTNIHMKLPASEMMVEQSKIGDSYGMDVWMWYPNLGTNYYHPDSVNHELQERHEVFKALPRLDALFVPGGDPGKLEPDELFSFLEKEAKVLHQYHPKAKIWVSPQVFKPTKEWFDTFYSHINREPDWLGGVVFGPWIKTPLEEVRARVNPNIPIRRYPDITHTIKCQYPIPNWDMAYAITLEREPINPRPNDLKTIHNAFAQYAQGSISYSEGINDDVNKMIWSDQDWNPETPVMHTLQDYVRYFISPDKTNKIAKGIMALEENLLGPLLVNDNVIRTFWHWQEIEKDAPSEVLSNYRFQMGLIRAYFDAYQYRRLIYETEIEQEARDVLLSAKEKGSLQAIKEASEILSRAWENPILPILKERCENLADSLFNNIGAQLTVEKHHGVEERGNFIDKIDLPLNDAFWLLHQFSEIKKLQNEDHRLAKIEQILHRTNPGPGGFYDNFGSPRSWSKVKSNVTWEEDPGTLMSPRVSFGFGLKGDEWVHPVKVM